MLDLAGIPIVDQHAHNLLRPEHLDATAYASAFTEAYDGEVVALHARETLFFRRSSRDLAAVLGCEPDFPTILATRDRLGFDEVARRFLEASRLEALLLDDGFLPDRVLPIEWHTRFAPAYRLLRIEMVAERLVPEASSWSDFQEAFVVALDGAESNVVGLKSVVAYRTGLEVHEADPEAAESCFRALRERAQAGERVRLVCKPLNDWVVWCALRAASRRSVPFQFHTGFGDPDLDLRRSNPLHLRGILEDRSLRRVPIILLHASYPFTREAGYLAAVYGNVHIDLGLAIPALSVAGMSFVVRAALELAPVSKILFSTDAHHIPELFYLGATWGRRALTDELTRATRDGDLTVREAERAAEAILRGNALQLYRLHR